MNQQLIGVGLRPPHYPHIESADKIRADWFEAISENYMNSEGRPLEMLLKVRSQFELALHGVSLSIGSSIRMDYLKKLKQLIERVEPKIVSDHLCWTGSAPGNSHDLLPLPFTKEALNKVIENVGIVQDFLGRKILLENISYYLRFKESDMDEADFILEICKKTGCGLLLDLNNIYVNAVNHGFNPVSFLNKIPASIIGQYHVAGPSQEQGYLFDTHSTAAPDAVWKLLQVSTENGAMAPVIVEWDQDIPEFSFLENEVNKAREITHRFHNAPKKT